MTSQPTRQRPAWVPFAIAVGVMSVMVLWAVLASGPSPTVETRETFTLTGQVSVPARVGTFVPDGGCIGDRGYTDIQPGAQVTVSGSSGTVLATGTLTSGRPDSMRCAYTFSVADVPRGEGSYQVEVSSRGKVRFDEAAVVSGGALLTLG